ncbi:MAG: 4Fe-4S binding protein [Lentisphaerae bacterium]|nr:4Fe-4S binding protein [Lentisphaerota bacterium]
MISLEINGIPVKAPAGMSILNAAKQANVKIPTLCYHPDLKAWAACGICVVRNGNSPKLLRACCTEVAPGMKIITHDPEIVKIRRSVLELILSTHPNDCLQCPRNGNCELQKLAADFGIRNNPFEMRIADLSLDTSTPALVINPSKCVKCGRCVLVCQEMQGVWALEFLQRGEEMRIAPAADCTLAESPCIKCGQCSAHCPVGAIYEKDDTAKVWDALKDPDLHCVVQIAPAVRVAIGEAFDLPPGTLMTGETYTALRRLGFKAIFDTNFSADVTIMEEANEFVQRFVKGTGELPLITSCCPAWTDYMEKYSTDFINNFSSCKSPQQMLSALAKSYYAEKMGLDPSKIFMVSVMPCTAKKFEISRSDNMSSTGQQDTDVVITTRELGYMLKVAGIDLPSLPKSDADNILGDYSGAGTIFGVTGGVMEAALRTAYNIVTGEDLDDVKFEAVRGMQGVKEATIDIKGTKVRIAVAHQMGNVEQMLEAIREDRKAGRKPRYDFIEVMACRGGCISGGGQPLGVTDAVRAARTKGIYSDDERSVRRCSHHNPYVIKLYEDYLGAPLSEKAHELLHNEYHKRKLYSK